FDDVQQVGSGQAAIKLMETQSFDLILTDVNMPDMTGLELVHLIRSGKTHAKADTRILVLTGYSNTEMLGVALALDVNGFLVKPLIPAVLDEKITQAMMENLKLRPPLAYLSVTTEVHDLPQADTSTKPHIGAATLRNPSETAPRVTRELSQRVHMSRLRPGMVVREDVCAKDGTLLLKSGQVLTELSINRINDLSGFLGDTTFVVEEPK
ncbi:MAG: response regulator, partial [Fimbriimonadaceae bacterium]